MNTATVLSPSLAHEWVGRAERPALRQLLLLAAGVALMTLSARIQVPFWPVPVTMQTYVVMVLGMAYGGWLGVGTMVTYLALGAVGLPVFASGGGLAYFAGPTGGYLVGFAAAAALLSRFAAAGWDRSAGKALAAMFLAHGVVFVFGVAWLSTLIGLERAIAAGFTPFVVGTVLKCALAAVTLPLAWRLLGRR